MRNKILNFDTIPFTFDCLDLSIKRDTFHFGGSGALVDRFIYFLAHNLNVLSECFPGQIVVLN